MSVYEKARKISPLIRFVMNIRYEGSENLPQTGPVILCCNHRSNSDPVLVGAVLDRNLFFMAKAELFKVPVLKTIVRMFGAFPVRRGAGDKEAIRKAYRILKDGNVLAMFPEGKRNKPGGLPLKFKTGAAQFACKTGAPVVPAAILCKGKLRFFKRKFIRIGKPVTAEQLGFTDGSADNIRLVNERLREAVIALMGDAV